MGNLMTMGSPRVQERLREIKELIKHESLTRREIQAKTSVGIKVLRNYLVYLQENNEIYIEHFHKVGKTYAPCFRSGDRPDVKREVLWVPRCDWAASWVPIRRRDEEVQA
jgi:hypothetical protein